jgi:hypothetical protein
VWGRAKRGRGRAALNAGWLLGWMLAVAISAMPCGVITALELQVVSATRLELEVLPLGRRPKVKGRLMDNVNQGVSGATLLLEIRRQGARGGQVVVSKGLQTDALGYFEEEVRLDDGAYVVSLRFEGGAAGLYEGSDAQQRLEVERWPTVLTVEAPGFVHVGSVPGVGVSWSLGVRLQREEGEAKGAQGERIVRVSARGGWSQEVRLGGVGVRAEVSLKQGAEGAPLGWGAQTLTATFDGDDLLMPASAQASCVVLRDLKVALSGQMVRERERRGVVLAGSVTSEDGDMEGVRVLIERRRGGEDGFWEKVGEVKASAGGSFSGFIEEDQIPDGVWTFQARALPGVGEGATSARVDVEIKRSGVGDWAPWLFGGLLLGGGVLALGAWAVGRLAVWWREWREARRRWVEVGSGVQTVRPVEMEDVPGDIPDEPDVIGGRVFDVLDGEGVDGVKLTLRDQRTGETQREGLTTHGGGFVWTGVKAGRFFLEAMANGYVTARVEVWSPHDGSLRYFRLNFTPVRQRVRERYAWLLDRYAPERGLWGQQTPQEIREELLLIVQGFHARGEGEVRDTIEAPMGRLRALLEDRQATVAALWEVMTALLEEVYFSARLYPEALLVDMDRLCAQLEGPLVALRRGQEVKGGDRIGRSRSERSAAREVG